MTADTRIKWTVEYTTEFRRKKWSQSERVEGYWLCKCEGVDDLVPKVALASSKVKVSAIELKTEIGALHEKDQTSEGSKGTRNCARFTPLIAA